jgi:hypothetical protein
MAVALNSNALITAEELQIFLNTSNITSNVTAVTDASYQNTLINMASDFIERFCNRVFISAVYTAEVYDGDGSHYLYLEKYPLTSSTITLVIWDTLNNQLLQTLVLYTDYLIDNAANSAIWGRSVFIKGKNNYRVTYTAGYTIDDVPYDLKNACAKLAGSLFYNQGKTGVASEKIGSYAISYDKNPNNIYFHGFPVPIEIAGVLEQYRRFNI